MRRRLWLPLLLGTFALLSAAAAALRWIGLGEAAVFWGAVLLAVLAEGWRHVLRAIRDGLARR